MKTTNKYLYEVMIVADEPWSDGLRRAYNEAILDYVQSDLSIESYEDCGGPDFSNADDQLAGYDTGYVGYGLNAHPKADQFDFSSVESADLFQSTMRYHLQGTGASVVQYTLAAEDDVNEPEAEVSASIGSALTAAQPERTVVLPINPAIRREIAEKVVAQAHPGYSKAAQGEWYTDGARLYHVEDTAPWLPWSDDAVVVSVDRLVYAYGGAGEDRCDFNPQNAGGEDDDEYTEAAIDFCFHYVPEQVEIAC